MQGKSHTEAQKQAWKQVEGIIQEFKSADKYVFSLPMWNYGIPYKLKHYIDIIAQPSYTFSFSPETGYKGLVTNKNALLIYARGGTFGVEREAFDFQKPYMETFLKFIGFDNLNSIVIEPTLGNSAKKAEEQAKQLALTF
jgi:FMN-dependent NADH-azoreductase